mgnify:CR=1 FL=1
MKTFLASGRWYRERGRHICLTFSSYVRLCVTPQPPSPLSFSSSSPFSFCQVFNSILCSHCVTAFRYPMETKLSPGGTAWLREDLIYPSTGRLTTSSCFHWLHRLASADYIILFILTSSCTKCRYSFLYTDLIILFSLLQLKEHDLKVVQTLVPIIFFRWGTPVLRHSVP